VCPWNQKSFRKGPIVIDPELEPRPDLINPALDWLASLDEKSFEREFNGSPVRRAGFQGLRRNVAVAMGNSGVAQYAAKLEEWATAGDEGLRAAARWALAKLRVYTVRTSLGSECVRHLRDLAAAPSGKLDGASYP
jgi:epoxyqueuosine reductase